MVEAAAKEGLEADGAWCYSLAKAGQIASMRGDSARALPLLEAAQRVWTTEPPDGVDPVHHARMRNPRRSPFL